MPPEVFLSQERQAAILAVIRFTPAMNNCQMVTEMVFPFEGLVTLITSERSHSLVRMFNMTREGRLAGKCAVTESTGDRSAGALCRISIVTYDGTLLIDVTLLMTSRYLGRRVIYDVTLLMTSGK